MIHELRLIDIGGKPAIALTKCDVLLRLPEWTGTGWTSEPVHTLEAERVTCEDCKGAN